MARFAIPLLVILILGAIVASQTFYIVDETQLAIVTRFGAFKEAHRSPGLYVKTPLADSVTKLDKRLLRVDAPPAALLTADKRQLLIDAYVRYRIIDPLKFFKTLRTESRAASRVENIVGSELRREVALDLQTDIISETREEIMRRVTEGSKRLDITRAEAQALPAGGLRDLSLEIVIAGGVTEEGIKRDRVPTAEERETIIRDGTLEGEEIRYRVPLVDRFGIEVVDVRIKRADFPSGVASSIYDRMRAERQRIASAERAEGAEQDAVIRARVDREVQFITQAAEGEAAQIRGDAEKTAIETLAVELGRDPEFYAFQRSLEAYRKLLDGDSTIILNADSDLFLYLESPLAPEDRPTE